MEPINPYASPQLGSLIDERHPPAVPVTLAETLRLGTSLYLANLLPIVGITLTFWLPIELVESYLTYFPIESEDSEPTSYHTLLLHAVVGLIPFTSVMAIGAEALQGQQPAFHRAFVAGFAAWPRVFAARLTISVSILLATILFIIPGIYLAVRTVFAEPTALIEHRGGMSAPGRSFELTKGRFWRTLALICIVYGPLYVASYLSQLPLYYFDHWLLYASLSLAIDLFAGWGTIILVTEYWSAKNLQQHSPH